MKTTITRSDVHVFERHTSKLFRSGDVPQTVSFAPCSNGIQFIAFGKDAVLRMTTPSHDVVEPFTLPWSAIKELAAKKHDVVELSVEGDSVAVTYSLGGVSSRTIFQLTKAGKLPHKRLGSRVVYSIEALKRFVNEPDQTDEPS